MKTKNERIILLKIAISILDAIDEGTIKDVFWLSMSHSNATVLEEICEFLDLDMEQLRSCQHGQLRRELIDVLEFESYKQ